MSSLLPVLSPPPPPPLFHTDTQNPSLQSALAVRQVAQKLRCCGCKVVRLGFIGICREEFEFGAKTAVVGFPENGFPEKCTGEKDCREEPADEDVEEARVAGLPTLILLLLLEEAVLVLMLSSSALLAGSSEDLNGDKIKSRESRTGSYNLAAAFVHL